MPKVKHDLKPFTQKLLKAPKKDKGLNAPKFYGTKPNAVHQADLLFLPTDKGFKYLLVVVDVATKKIDALPLRTKSASTVKTAFVKIYNGKVLKMPQRIEIDPGTEFKSQVADYFEDNDVFMRVGKPGRHRQQAIVERVNQSLGTAIFLIQLEKELKTGKNSRLWLHLYKPIIEQLNSKVKPIKPRLESPTCEGDSCNLLSQGDKVLVALDEPKDVEGKKLIGKFRSTDMKYDLKIRIIKEIIIKPNFPPMYLLDGKSGDNKVDPTAYTKNQLMMLTTDDMKKLEKFQ
jgi:Integrase core domain